MKAYRITYKEQTGNFESFRFEYFADVRDAREAVRDRAELIATRKGIRVHVSFIQSDETHFLRFTDCNGNEVSLSQMITPFPLVIREINIK